MHVCGGTLTTNSRKSCQIGRSTNGISSTNPGPRAPMDLPNRNTTIRLYSGTILIAAVSSPNRPKPAKKMKIQVKSNILASNVTIRTWSFHSISFTLDIHPADPQCNSFYSDYDDRVASSNRLFSRCFHHSSPQLASDLRGTDWGEVSCSLPYHADQPVYVADGRGALRLEALAHRKEYQRSCNTGDCYQQPGVDGDGRQSG